MNNPIKFQKISIYKIAIAIIIAVILFEASAALADEPNNPFLFGIKGFQQGVQQPQKFLPDITKCGKLNAKGERVYDFGTCLLWFFDKILSIIYTLALFLAVIFLVYAGILYITEPGKAPDIHKRLTYGIVGIVVAVISFSLVKAIEISLSTSEEGIAQAPSTQITPDGTGDLIKRYPQVIVEAPQILEENNSLYLTLVAYLNKPAPEGERCDMGYALNNLTKGKTIGSGSFTERNITTVPYTFSFGLSSGSANYGDKILLSFNYITAKQNCALPNKLTLTVPQKSAGTVIVKGGPYIKIGKPAIFGQQRLTIELPETLKDAIVQTFDIFLRQVKLYDPPFYLYLSYSAEPEPSQSSNCTFVVLVSGARVSSYTTQPVPAQNIKFFNQTFSFNLPLERDKKNYSKILPIGLSDNIIEQVKLRGVELRNCTYNPNGDATVWSYSTRITAR